MSKLKQQHPAHLYFILAREAPVGLILRYGPAAWVQLIKWNTDTDTEYTSSWTALSRLPFLTALALWPHGNHPSGGGMFLSNSELLLNSRSEPHPNHQPAGLTLRVIQVGYSNQEYIPIRERKLKLSGWELVDRLIVSGTSTLANGTVFTRTVKATTIRQKQQLMDGYILRWRNVVTLNSNDNSFSVADQRNKISDIPGSPLADWDQRGRLVFVREGKLFAAEMLDDGLTEHELADFNANKFEPIIAPEWATRW